MVWTLDRHKNWGGSWLIVVQPVTTLAIGGAEERCHVPDIEWQYAPGRWNMTENSTLAVVRVQITVLENKVTSWLRFYQTSKTLFTSRVQESSAEIQSMEYRVQSTGGWMAICLWPLLATGSRLSQGPSSSFHQAMFTSNRLTQVLNKFDKVVTLKTLAHFCYLG